jgi:hypothetical protein
MIGRIALSALLALAAGAVLAGPNEGILLMVHGVPPEEDARNCEVPETCEELTSNTQPNVLGIEWFLVVMVSPPENEPNFNTIWFTIGDYDSQYLYIAFTGPCHQDLDPLEVSAGGWPMPNSGTGVTWVPHCLTSHIEPVYYIGTYIYAPGVIHFGDFYGSSPFVSSCEDPPTEDPIAGFASMGFGGEPGSNPECPEPPTPIDERTWGRIKKMYR